VWRALELGLNDGEEPLFFALINPPDIQEQAHQVLSPMLRFHEQDCYYTL
jgi:hypothetical protein